MNTGHIKIKTRKGIINIYIEQIFYIFSKVVVEKINGDKFSKIFFNIPYKRIFHSGNYIEFDSLKKEDFLFNKVKKEKYSYGRISLSKYDNEDIACIRLYLYEKSADGTYVSYYDSVYISIKLDDGTYYKNNIDSIKKVKYSDSSNVWSD